MGEYLYPTVAEAMEMHRLLIANPSSLFE